MSGHQTKDATAFAILLRVARGESLEHYETERLRKDGSKVPISLAVSPIRDEHGRIQGVSAISRDVTDLRLQERLRQSEERYGILFDSIDEGFCTIEVLFDPDERPVDYRFLEVNPAFAKQAGIADAPGRRMREIAPRLEEHWFQIYGRVARTGEPVRFESEAAELHRCFDVYAFRVGEPEERKVAILFTDITGRKRTEAALRESENAFRTLTDAMPQFVWACTPDGLNVYFSQQWVNYTGLSSEQSSGTQWSTPFHPDDTQAAWDAWNRATATGETYEVESRLRAADGTYRWFLMRGVPLRDADGRILKWFGTCTDIEDLKRAEEQARRLNEELEDRVRERTAELRATEQALRDREEQLALALRASQEGVWDWNLETDEVWYSPRWKNMLGYAEGEIEPHKAAWERLVHPDDRVPALEMIEEVLRGEREYEIEFRLRHKEGYYVPILSRGCTVRRQPGGRVIRIVGTHLDLTERKAAEAERRRGFYHRSLIEASLDPLVTIAADGKIQDVNQATEAVTGLSRQELIGTDFCEYFTDPERARAGYRQAFREGSVQDYELEIRGPGGQTTPVLYNASVYRDDSGNVAGVFAAARDISRPKQAEAALRRTMADLEAERRRFRDVLDRLPAYVILLKPDYHVPFANLFFRERFGESHGKRCFEYLFGRSQPCEVCDSFTALKTNQPHRWEWTGPDGRNYDIYDFPFTDTDGSRLVLEMGIDITVQKQAEKAIQEVNASLERRVTERTAELVAANKELESFSYSVSHDLRAPLRVMNGYCQVLLEDYSGSLEREAQALLERIRAASQRMDHLIAGILLLSRTSRSEMRRTSVDLSALAQAVVEELQHVDPERAVEYVIKPRLVVKGDANLLRTVLENLLGNAWKFTSKHTRARIEFGVVVQGGQTVYFVCDDGAGFDMTYGNKLFGAFQRLHTPAEFEGTGIGLATVQRIIQRHGGRVWAEAEVEKGATFYFTIPGQVEEI